MKANKHAAWWKSAVIYEIYARSFQDTNADGIGDLRGIIERLPYLIELGIDAIWISPIFPSPMIDFGYDVSNYVDIDPLFGTLRDFDELLTRAHGCGLRICSILFRITPPDQHPWFVESRGSRAECPSGIGISGKIPDRASAGPTIGCRLWRQCVGI